jgi:O-antigen ligase
VRTTADDPATTAPEVCLDSRPELWLWRLVAASLLILPLTVIPGKDTLRLAKQLCLTAEGLICGAYLSIALTVGSLRLPPKGTWRSVERFLPFAIVLWTGITAVLSTNRGLSFRTVIWVCCAVAIYTATALTAGRNTERSLWLLLTPALINGILAILQAFDIWNPFRFPPNTSARDRTTALLGNPDDVASYLVIPALAALTMSYVTRGRQRWSYFACSTLLIIALMVSQAMTAMIALAVGVIALFSFAGKKARIILFAAAVVAAVTITAYAPIRIRVNAIRVSLITGDVDSALTSRVSAILTATNMFLEHPLVGVGPGAFGFNYFDYKLASDARFGSRFASFNAVNFGEVHNDHLQVLATTGAPGYALMLASFLAIARRSFSRNRNSESVCENFVRSFAFPFSATVFVLAIGQFPLELGAPLSVILTFAAICVAWSPR